MEQSTDTWPGACCILPLGSTCFLVDSAVRVNYVVEMQVFIIQIQT